MRRLLLVLGLAALSALPAVARAEAPAVTASLSPSTVAVQVGERFVVRAEVRNDGAIATAPLLAHLDVVSLQTDVYVDPEDWSDSRSRPIVALAPAQSATIEWSVRAVNAGRFDVHVVVLPILAGRAGPIAVSTPTYVTVTARRTINPGGSLAVVLGVPGFVGLASLASRLAVRRRRVTRP